MAVHVQATRAIIGRSLTRSYRHYSLASSPFTTTSNYSNSQFAEQALKDDIAAVPSAPEHRPELHIYKDIVKPQDVCDLFFRPDMTDIVVTSLAKSCAIHGDSSYKVVSKSAINESNFVFANIAIQWMKEFKAGVYPLTDLPKKNAVIAYNSIALEKQVLQLLDENATSSAASLASFFDKLSQSNISLDSAVKVLLPRLKSAQEYELLVDHLDSHYLELNPQTLKEFLATMLDDLSSNATLERVERFEGFFSDKLMQINPNLLEELDPATLAQLAYVTTFSSTLSTSSQALSIIVETYKAAPPKQVYELYMSRFRKVAVKENYSRKKILEDLSQLKPILHHYGMSLASFDFLMKHAITSVQGLSNFVKFAKSSSASVLSQRTREVMDKLETLQSAEDKSSVVKKLEKSQLHMFLVE